MKTRTIKKPASLQRTGFTLTELLIVMAILVLLVSLVGPRLLGSKKKADINSVKTQIGLLNSALERYATDMNRFPNTEEGLAALIKSNAETGTQSSWDGPYLNGSKLPSDPWGNSFAYEYPPSRSQTDMPEIWSYGPDGQENTEDDIVSWTPTEDAEDPNALGTTDLPATSAN